MDDNGSVMCKRWREFDGEYIWYEVCGGNNKGCTCSGVREQCDYPEHFKTVEVTDGSR